MTRRSLLRSTAAPAAVALLSCQARRRPNIVMIMADDMGYSDLGCYGGEIPTPNLDRLGYEGLRFTRYYTNNMCVPTRAALMTGVQSDLSMTKEGLSPECETVAEALRRGGYSTYMAGKWHLSGGNEEPYTALPNDRGFDSFFGTIGGAASYWAPFSLRRNDRPCPEEFDREDFYYTDAISDEAVRCVREHDAANPFFLYVAYTAAHWPLHARDEDVSRHKGKYAEGWDVLRKRRHARMLELGVVDPAWPLSPRHPDVPAWEDEPHQEWQQRRMEVYAAQVEVMDQGVGRILRALEATGRLDDTLVCFQIDNGGCHVEYPPTRKGPYLPEKTRAGAPMRPGNLLEIMPGPEDTYQSYGYGWANASNTPFRLFKQHDHEGGITTPLIARLAGVIQPGLTDQLAHVTDLAPTFLDLAGVDSRSPTPLDGRSLLPVLRGGEREPPEVLCWRWSHGRALRAGRWKLVAVDDQPWELYDIERDGTELHNLAAAEPEQVARLAKLWNDWAARSS